MTNLNTTTKTPSTESVEMFLAMVIGERVPIASAAEYLNIHLPYAKHLYHKEQARRKKENETKNSRGV